MTNERMNLNLKLIEEKINNKFLELKYNFESQNEEINQKIKEINIRLDKIFPKNQSPIPSTENFSKLEKDLKAACEKYDSKISSINAKLEEIQKDKKRQRFDLNIYKEKIESSMNLNNNNKTINDNKSLLDIIFKQMQKYDNDSNNKINSLENKIDELKKENDFFKERIKKIDNEFNLIKIRFGELLDFIRDKNFWNKFISKIIEQNNLINKKNCKNDNQNNEKEENNNINNIYAPFNYYIYFGVENNKDLIDEAMNTTNKNFKNADLNNSDKNYNLEVKNILINEQINDINKYKTPNNVPNINILKSFREVNNNLFQNLQRQNNSSIFNNTNYKKIPKHPFIKYKEQYSLNNEDNHESLYNALNNNKSATSNDNKLNRNKKKKKTKVNEYIIQANCLNGLGANKNRNNNDSENLSEAYILRQSKTIKKINFSKNDQKYYQTLPLSMKYNLRNYRNNSMNRFNIISYKDLKKGNLEDLYYSKLKKEKIGPITGINLRPPDSVEHNNLNNKRKFPMIHRGKTK